MCCLHPERCCGLAVKIATRDNGYWEVEITLETSSGREKVYTRKIELDIKEGTINLMPLEPARPPRPTTPRPRPPTVTYDSSEDFCENEPRPISGSGNGGTNFQSREQTAFNITYQTYSIVLQNAMMIERPITVMTFLVGVGNKTDRELQRNVKDRVRTISNVSFGHLIRKINFAT